MFYMLQRYPHIRHAVINDINTDLTTCYRIVRDKPKELIKSLHGIEGAYINLKDKDSKQEFFMQKRARYNTKNIDDVENTTLFIFLNRTCFNGLYRVNKSGLFNVPFGKYEKPLICDEETVLNDSKLLQNVEILSGDFEQTLDYAVGRTIFYFDPPYRPLSDTSSFNDYTKESFNDSSQIRLKEFCDKVHDAGHYFMLSNSDCKGKNESDNFFDTLYSDYYIERVWASRNINADASKRGKLTELLIRNYEQTNTGLLNQEILPSDVAENIVQYGKEL